MNISKNRNLLEKLVRLSTIPRGSDYLSSTPGPREWAHYGLMIPNLPAPHRFFSYVALVGDPGPAMYQQAKSPFNRKNQTSIIATTAATHRESFEHLHRENDCALTDFTQKFSSTLNTNVSAEGHITLEKQWPDSATTLSLTAVPTGTSTIFFSVPGIYHHWSQLCNYTGIIKQGKSIQQISGTCNYEYARGLRLPLTAPLTFFTYQILELNSTTQLLLTCVQAQLRNPVTGKRHRVPILRTAYLRDTDSDKNTGSDKNTNSGENTSPPVNCQLNVTATTIATTPHGEMHLPQTWQWKIPELNIEIDCHNDQPNWGYGLGTGFSGSFQFAGRQNGLAISGLGYCEYIDLP